MASLKEIRRRIQSIDNIKQITKSMEMIAAARFQRALTKAENSNRYMLGIREIIRHLIAANPDKNHPLFIPSKGNRTAIIVAGADRGLCGAYNSNLFNALDAFLQNYGPNEVELQLFGRKAIDYYSRKKWPIGLTIPNWGEHIGLQDIKKIVKELTDKFLNGTYSAIRLVYTRHITIFSREIVQVPLLPLELAEEKTQENTNYILEPSLEKLSRHLLPHYCVAEVLNMLNQAYASELAARVCAMRSAAKNAQEIKERLTLERNKLRQTSITKEVLEISSAALCTH